MSMLLASFGDILNMVVSIIVERFQLKTVIAGVVFAIIGIVFITLARRITRVIRQNNEVDNNDTIYLIFKAVGLACLFVALLILIFKDL